MMMWSIFISAMGLLLVLEGVMPFLSPRYWRNAMLALVSQSDRVVRITGLILMLLGLGLVILARDFY